jgi:hypothetical protein
MAETLSVTEMLPNKFETKRKFRWVLMLEGIDAFLVKSTSRPSFTIADETLNFINSKRYIAGRLTFNTINMVLHDPIAPSGAQQVMEWIRTHAESVSGRAGYADFYKRDLQLKLLDPIGTVVELWDMKGCFLTSADYGSLDYNDDSGSMDINLTIRFDNCVLQY